MPSWLTTTITALAPLLKAGRVSPVEITQAALDRIAAENPRLNAFLTVTGASALEQARQAEAEIRKGKYRGPLHGVPISVKDLFYTRGVRTTAGSKILSDFIPRSDAVAVRMLRTAGAVLLGKTALHEWAYGVTNNNPHFGPTRNPHNPACVPGGSSGGSAVAVSTGMGYASLGTDTGGSIRIPASLCGVTGLKPTFGLVSTRGVIPLGATLDHVGPLTRSVEDAALLLEALTGKRVKEFREGVRGLRIGVPEKFFFERIHADVEKAVRNALAQLQACGARLVNVHVNGAHEANEAGRTILLVEALKPHRRYRAKRTEYGLDVRGNLERGEKVQRAELREAQRVRARFSRELNHIFARVDVLITPTTPVTAPRIGATTIEIAGHPEDLRPCMTRLVRCFNLAGLPAMSVPCGRDPAGLPIGMQIAAKKKDEATVLRAGLAWERA